MGLFDKKIKNVAHVLIDRSGSMLARKDETLSAINGYIQKMQETSPDTILNIATFDSPVGGWSQSVFSYDVVRNVPASICKPINPAEIHPRGNTPLYDAIGRLDADIRRENPEKAVILILTDGEENCSTSLTKETAKLKLDELRALGIEVIFMAVDFNNFSDARSLGLNYGSTINTQAFNLRQTFDGVAASTAAYFSGNTAKVEVSDALRAAAGDKRTKAAYDAGKDD